MRRVLSVWRGCDGSVSEQACNDSAEGIIGGTSVLEHKGSTDPIFIVVKDKNGESAMGDSVVVNIAEGSCESACADGTVEFGEETWGRDDIAVCTDPADDRVTVSEAEGLCAEGCYAWYIL